MLIYFSGTPASSSYDFLPNRGCDKVSCRVLHQRSQSELGSLLCSPDGFIVFPAGLDSSSRAKPFPNEYKYKSVIRNIVWLSTALDNECNSFPRPSAANQIKRKGLKWLKGTICLLLDVCVCLMYSQDTRQNKAYAQPPTRSLSARRGTQIRPVALFHAVDMAIVNHMKDTSIHLRRSSLFQTRQKFNFHICQLLWHSQEKELQHAPLPSWKS